MCVGGRVGRWWVLWGVAPLFGLSLGTLTHRMFTVSIGDFPLVISFWNERKGERAKARVLVITRYFLVWAHTKGHLNPVVTRIFEGPL